MENRKTRERAFKSTANFFIRKPTEVFIIDSESVLGYTVVSKEMKNRKQVDVRHIYVSDTCTAIERDKDGNEISEKIRQFMLYGVLGHEILHQKYTAFDHQTNVGKALKKAGAKYVNRFHEICNLVEDPAIESAAPCIFGGPLLKALDMVIQHCYDTAPDIDFNVPEGEIIAAWQQIRNAFVQLGDRGPVKGKFQTAEAEYYFKLSEPKFREAVAEKEGTKRIDRCAEIYWILEPLFDLIKQNGGNNSNQSNSSQSTGGQGNGERLPDDATPQLPPESRDSDGTGNGNGSEEGENEKTKSGNSGETDAEDTSENDGTQSGTSKGNANKKCKTKGKSETPESNAQASDSQQDDSLEKALEEFAKKLNDAGKEIKEEEAHEEQRRKKVAGDVEADTDLIHCRVKAYPADKDYYERVICDRSTQIASLSRELAKIFRGDRGGKKIGSSGVSVEARRVASPVLSTRIMKGFSAPKDLSDFALYILVDESGSMKHINKYKNARESVICIYEAFADLGIPIYISGFSAKNHYPVQKIYRTWHSADSDKYALANIDADNCNYDFLNIADATASLKKRNEKHKLLVVLSDGAPCGLNGIHGFKATQEAIKEARRTGITVVGVAICPDVEEVYSKLYGENYTVVNDVEGMFSSISGIIQKAVKRW